MVTLGAALIAAPVGISTAIFISGVTSLGPSSENLWWKFWQLALVVLGFLGILVLSPYLRRHLCNLQPA